MLNAHRLCVMTNGVSTYPPSAVHRNVRAEIARSGSSQATIADLLGLTQSAVSRRLSGKIDFSATELSKLAAYLNVPVAAFFTDMERAS